MDGFVFCNEIGEGGCGKGLRYIEFGVVVDVVVIVGIF